MQNGHVSRLAGLVALALVGSTGAAFATTYDFSYAFAGDGSGHTVTGSFTGTGTSLNDITVTGVLSMSIDGAAITGPFYFTHYSPSTTAPTNDTSQTAVLASGATVSADSSLSNFVFSTSSTAPTNPGPGGAFFYVIQPWYQTVFDATAPLASSFLYPNGSYINFYNGQYAPANFSVSVAAAVPEPPTWAVMLLGFAGLGLARHRGRKNSAA
jgi:hypothetical protein